MPNFFYLTKSKVSIVTTTKKPLSLAKEAFKERPLDYTEMPNIVCLDLQFEILK